MAADTSALPTSNLRRLMQSTDVVMAAAVVMIISLMIIPMPMWLLDILLTTNIGLAVTILLVSLYISEPLDFSVFPSLLLIVTLYRLSLEISATRLILLHAEGGQVIQAFGQFVVGGNYVVGIVVFLIIMVIQFVVITNGAGRVAEVAARFTLDAMPGKQMSIDADLNAGLLTEDEARKRRRQIENEADFYGAMDGASKFVKGDAIAAIIIVIVNIFGGFVIGVWQLGMPLSQALQTYTLLTVGEGLVAQVPALLISTATGIVVTRTASEADMGHDVFKQLGGNPRTLGVVSVLLFMLALVPGLPKLPFFVMSFALGGVAWLGLREKPALTEEPSTEQTTLPPAEDVMSLLQVDPLALEIGYALVPLVDVQQGGNLLERITMIRRQVAMDLGIVLPKIRIRDNLRLSPNTYVIKLRGETIAEGELMMNHLMAMPSGKTEQEIEGISTREPAFGLPARWINQGESDRAEMLGYTVVDPLSVLTTHLSEVIKRHSPEILGRQEVKDLLDNLKDQYPAVLEGLVPDLLNISDIQAMLQNLLREQVPIRDLVTILETVGTFARDTRDADFLSERARHALGRTLTNQFKSNDGSLHVLTLSPQTDQWLQQSLEAGSGGLGSLPQVSPSDLQRLLQKISVAMEELAKDGYQPVLLSSASIRLSLRRLTERSLPNLAVLSYNEVSPDVEIYVGSMIDLNDESTEGGES